MSSPWLRNFRFRAYRLGVQGFGAWGLGTSCPRQPRPLGREDTVDVASVQPYGQ